MGNKRSKLITPPDNINDLVNLTTHKKDITTYIYNHEYVLDYICNHPDCLHNTELLKYLMSGQKPFRSELFDLIYDMYPKIELKTLVPLVNFISTRTFSNQCKTHVLTHISNTIDIDVLMDNFTEWIEFLFDVTTNPTFRENVLTQLLNNLKIDLLMHNFIPYTCFVLAIPHLKLKNAILTQMYQHIDESYHFTQSKTTNPLIQILETIYELNTINLNNYSLLHIIDFRAIMPLIIKLIDSPHVDLTYRQPDGRMVLHYLTGNGYEYNPNYNSYVLLRQFLDPLAVRLIRKLPKNLLSCENDKYQTPLGNAKTFQLYYAVLELEKQLKSLPIDEQKSN